MEEQYEYVLVKDSKDKESIRKFLLGNLAHISSLNLFSKRGTLFSPYTGILLREGVRYGEYDDAPGQEFDMFPENPPSVMYIGLHSMYGTEEPMDYYFVPYDEFLKDLQEVKEKILSLKFTIFKNPKYKSDEKLENFLSDEPTKEEPKYSGRIEFLLEAFDNIFTEKDVTNLYLLAIKNKEKEMIEQKFSASGLPTKRVFFKINS